jgi:hypothetical protein
MALLARWAFLVELRDWPRAGAMEAGVPEVCAELGWADLLETLGMLQRVATERSNEMMKARKQASRGREQNRARAAGGQGYELRYEAKRTGTSKAAVKKALKKIGVSRKRVERRLAR